MASKQRGPLAFLVFRDEGNRERTFALNPGVERVRIGRGAAADLRLGWDRQISRIHAELERLGDGWALIDDGLSANGTQLNGARLLGRRRLASGDLIGVGTTSLTFRTIAGDGSRTFIPALAAPPVELTRLQRQVLTALCRPYPATGSPATNQQIADELHVSIAAVKTHLRALFEKLAIAGLPQNQKRARLAVLALERGLINVHELAD